MGTSFENLLLPFKGKTIRDRQVLSFNFIERNDKRMIQDTQEQALFLASNTSPVIFQDNDLKTKSATCCGWLQHAESSPVYKIIEGGVYEISFNANITSLTAGVVALTLLEDGVPVTGTTVISTIATAGDYENVSFDKKIKVCCKANATFSVASIPSVPVYSAVTPVTTDTEIPIITNANFSITRLY